MATLTEVARCEILGKTREMPPVTLEYKSVVLGSGYFRNVGTYLPDYWSHNLEECKRKA